MVDVMFNEVPGEFDTAHRDKLSEAILKTIVEASVFETEAGRIMHLKTGEIADAMSMVLAHLISSHKDSASPTTLRRLTEETAKRLFRRVGEARKAGAHKGFSFVTYDDEMQ